jgi:hypothetical protein
MAIFVQMQIQEQWFDINGDPAAGFVLKAYEVGTTTPVAIAIDSSGGSQQATITLNTEGNYEVSGNEITPYIDRNYKYAIFENATDAAANSNPYKGFYDNIVYDRASDESKRFNVDDYAALRALTSATYDDGDVIKVTDNGIFGDLVVKTGTVTDNGGTRVVFTDDANRYAERPTPDLIDPKWFGATGDGTTNDRAALSSADDLGSVLISDTYAIATGFTFDNPVVFQGPGQMIVPNAVTLTVNQIDAPRSHIFNVTAGGLVDLLHEVSYTEWFGANNSSDDEAVNEAVRSSKFVHLYGDTDFDTAVAITKPITIQGLSGANSITVPTSATDPAIDVSATGGTTREKVVIRDLNFTTGNGQCIKATATNPLEINNCRFDTGKESLKLATFYYGVARDCIFFKSGVDLNNVNNFDFIGTDANGNNAVSSGRYLATDYAFNLTNCISVQFSQMTFEVWDCNVFNMNGCKAMSFNRTWFEANDSERVFLLVDCANISFNDGCQIESTNAQTTDCWMQVANTTPSDSNRQLKTVITFNTADFVLRQSPTTTVPFIKTSDVAGAEKAIVSMNDCTLIEGFIHNPNLNTHLTVKRMMLSSPTNADDTKKGFTALDTVDVSDGQSTSWCLDNVNSEWDFATGTGGWARIAGIAATVTAATSMPGGAPPLTGTKVIKMATTTTGTLNMNLTMSDAGAVTADGETYFIAVKLWSTATCTAKIRLLDNASAPKDDSTTVAIGGDEWRWLVMKTNSANMASIIASGLDPILRIDFVTSTNPTDIYIDRSDFQIDNGDHYLP